MRVGCIGTIFLIIALSIYANPIPVGHDNGIAQRNVHLKRANPTGDEGGEPEPDTCPDYTTCQNKGTTYWDNLFNQLRRENPVDRKDGAAQFAKYYSGAVEYDESPDDTIEAYMKSIPLDFDNAFDKSLVSSRVSPDGPAYAYSAYENDYNPNQGVIVADTNNRRDDDTQKKLFWSEVVFQTYQISAARQGKDLSHLKNVFRVNIVNGATNNVVEAAYDKLGLTKTNPNEWVEWTIDEHRDSFIAFVGTDNVKGVAFLLQDHATAFGKRVITVIDTNFAIKAMRIQIGSFSDKFPDKINPLDPNSNTFVHDKTMRVLPLGDSITEGYRSTDLNGYRLNFVENLGGAGNTVNMIGSLQSGTAPLPPNDHHEGHDGATIDEINGYASSSLPDRPNVVLLHAGTNDMDRNIDADTAPDRLGRLIDKIIEACPDAAILVAQIVQSSNADTQARIVTYNKAIPGVVAQRANNGKHVRVVDMSAVVTTDVLFDSLHPNNEGYRLMANAWYAGLQQANQAGWIQDPVTVTKDGNGHAVCTHNVNWIQDNQIANGAGLGQNMWSGFTCNDALQDAGPGSLCECTFDNGHASLQPLSGPSCGDMSIPMTAAVHFADLNGDGRAEYLWVGLDGSVRAFYNQGGPKNGVDDAKVSWFDQGIIATGVGGLRSQIQFADLDGDGRAEYLVVHPNGSVEAWYNQGSKDPANPAKVGWFYQGFIATGIGKNGAGTRFADLNGDGRADYQWVDANGAITAYSNQGSKDPIFPAKVDWYPQGVIATGVGATRDEVVLADINGDGRADYLVVSRTDGSVVEWYNQGGPDNGPNADKVGWFNVGTIATGVGTDGKGVHFADLTGDGRAEYLDINPDTSAVNAWLNDCF